MSDDLPLGAFRFFVSLDAADAYLPAAQAQLVPFVSAGAFEQCSGLSADLEVLTYPEGGCNGFVHQLPVRHSWGRLTLRRGLIRDRLLWKWYEAGLSNSLGARRDGAILALDELGRPVLSWTFRGGLAAKWKGPDFAAMNNAIAVESLEIAHQGLEEVLLA